jgi:hypothetical protein
MSRNKADKASVVEHTLQHFLQKFLFFKANVQRMDSLFEASFSPLAASGMWGACSPDCRIGKNRGLCTVLLSTCQPTTNACCGATWQTQRIPQVLSLTAAKRSLVACELCYAACR